MSERGKGSLQLLYSINSYALLVWRPFALTHDDEPDPPPNGGTGGHVALVEAFVLRPRVLDLQLPVVGLLVEDLEAGVVAVRVEAESQQVRGGAMLLQPGHL